MSNKKVSYWQRLTCWHVYHLGYGMCGDAVECAKCGLSFYSNDFMNAIYELLGKTVEDHDARDRS